MRSDVEAAYEQIPEIVAALELEMKEAARSLDFDTRAPASSQGRTCHPC